MLTDDFLTGAFIKRAVRDEKWLMLETDRGEIHMAAGRVRLDLECPKCREHRLVEIVTDARGEQGFCAVCSHSWKIT